MIKKLLITILILAPFSFSHAQTILFPSRGGTGIGSVTAGDIGKCLAVSNNAPFAFTLGDCSGGGGTAVGWASTTLDINSIYFTGGSTGNVGIGTTTPWGKLSVTNTGTGPSFVVEDSTSPDTTPFVIDASGNVGIGTTTPGAKLNIAGAGTMFEALRLENDFNWAVDRGTKITFYTPYSSGQTKLGGEIVVANNASVSSNDMYFTTDTNGVVTEKMRITNTGNVGIGTTSPSAKLSVNDGRVLSSGSSYTNSGFVIEDRAAGGGDWRMLHFSGGSFSLNYSGDNSSYSKFLVDTSGDVGIGTTTPWGKLSVTNTGTGPSFVVEDSTSPDTTPFVIDASGNVGIGTTAPTQKLDVSGNARVTGYIESDDTTWGFYAPDNVPISIGNSADFSIGSVDGTKLSISAGTSLGSATGMTMTTSGNVGVGTTTPWGKLSVTNTGTGPSFVVEDSTSPDSSPFIIDASGNVGIGTTSPGAKLNITPSAAGSTVLVDRLGAGTGSAYWGFGVSNSSVTDQLIIGNSSTAYAGAAQWIGTSNSFLYYPTTFRIGTGVGTSPTMSFTSTGNVGIGSTTPYSKASVAKILSIEGTSAGLILNDSDIANKPWEIYNTGGDLFFYDGTAAVGNRVTIKNGGNVGIGTTSPGQKLSVAGDILGNNIIGSYFTSTSTSVASVFPYASTTALTATTLCLSTDCRTAWPAGGAGGSGAGFASTTLDINSVYFTGGATGKIGIGTSTPNATLTIATGKSFYSEQSILSTSTSMTVDFDNGQNQLIRTGVSDTTVAFSNGKVGQKVELTVCNPTTTSGALSFTGNVSYRGGISPSHTTTANECDIYVWQVNYATSTAKYFLVDMKSGFK